MVELSSCSLVHSTHREKLVWNGCFAEHAPQLDSSLTLSRGDGSYRLQSVARNLGSLNHALFRLLAFDTNTCQTILGLTHDSFLETFSQCTFPCTFKIHFGAKEMLSK